MARFGTSVRYPYAGGSVPVGYKLKHGGTLKTKKRLVKNAWKAGYADVCNFINFIALSYQIPLTLHLSSPLQ